MPRARGVQGGSMSPEQKDRLMRLEFNLEVLQEELSDAEDPAAADLARALRALDSAMRR